MLTLRHIVLTIQMRTLHVVGMVFKIVCVSVEIVQICVFTHWYTVQNCFSFQPILLVYYI